MFKVIIIIAILTGFAVDTSLKSVCAYNRKIESERFFLSEELSYLGKMSIKYYKTLSCENMDKPFIYKKQANELINLGNALYESIVGEDTYMGE